MKTSTKNIKFGFVFQLTSILSLSMIYIFQWGEMITNPALRTGADFMAFYSAGIVAQEYGIANTYKIPLQQKVQEDVVGFPLADEQVLLYNHIPYLIPILSLVVSENYIFSFGVWAALMLLVYTTANLIFIKTIQVNKNDYMFFIGIILFFPFFQSLLLGQDTAILFFGVVLWVVGMVKKKDWLVAFGLALTSVRPHLCLAFTIPLLFRDYRTSWKYIFTTGILALISVFMIGWTGTFDFINILQISAGGTWHGMNENAMFNMIGLLSRSLLFLEPSFIRILGWVGYVLTILFLSIYWGKKDKSLNWLISLTIILTLFFAPHLHYHDLTLLIVPILILGINYKNASKFILGISLALLIFTPLYYVLPYLLYAGLLWHMLKTGVSSSEPMR